ncbi:MAG: DUF2934 domain-containing protein [Opitutaceae bacterium]
MNQPPSISSISSPVDADAVSRRAFELWEKEGRPEGCDLRHWLQAEQECRTSQSDDSARNDTTATAAAANTGSDVRPLQGTRAAAAAGRDSKRASNPPFATQRSAVGHGHAPSVGKRGRSASTPPL